MWRIPPLLLAVHSDGLSPINTIHFSGQDDFFFFWILYMKKSELTLHVFLLLFLLLGRWTLTFLLYRNMGGFSRRCEQPSWEYKDQSLLGMEASLRKKNWEWTVSWFYCYATHTLLGKVTSKFLLFRKFEWGGFSITWNRKTLNIYIIYLFYK